MRFWEAPEQTDILVSELLGSFGDNELSPECLDGAQRFLKPDGVSIPQSYTSYLAPMTSFKLYKDCKGYKVRLVISSPSCHARHQWTVTHPRSVRWSFFCCWAVSVGFRRPPREALSPPGT